jgi:two-component system sensor histidine kinase CpxA
MTRLYWRIFISFWLVIIMTVIVTVAVNSIAFRDEIVNSRFSALRDSMELLSQQAQQALDEGGENGLRDWLQMREALQPVPPLLIVNPAGAEMLQRPLPAGLDRVRPETRPFSRTGANPRRARSPRVHRLVAADGQSYRMLVPGFRPRFGGWFLRPETRALFPLVLVLLSGAACLLLARYLTRPIRAFRAAGQSIAAGDLGARVGPSIAKRKDEFGELATDFDRMADRIEELLGSQQQLLRDVSHELRSPLARLQAAVGLIRQKSSDKADAHLDRIEQEAESLNELIGQILSMARLETGTSVDRQPVDLNRLVAEIVEDARYEGESHQKSIAFTAGEYCVMEIDESLMHKAIENVVRNAIRHSRECTEVSADRLPAGGVKITISDDGPGIDPADAERIFEPFFTRASDGGTAYSGAGVGLAIARRAVELHGGSIRARNADAGGFVVEIELSGG